jgi:predicted amidohydrolase
VTVADAAADQARGVGTTRTLLRGGRAIGPAGGFDGFADVLVTGDEITAVGRG